jgi:hypothetical protein
MIVIDPKFHRAIRGRNIRSRETQAHNAVMVYVQTKDLFNFWLSLFLLPKLKDDGVTRVRVEPSARWRVIREASLICPLHFLISLFAHADIQRRSGYPSQSKHPLRVGRGIGREVLFWKDNTTKADVGPAERLSFFVHRFPAPFLYCGGFCLSMKITGL